MKLEQPWKRQTALFLLSQTISIAGSSLVQYAMLWYVTLQTQSGSMMTIYIICSLLPSFFLSPFAGVWADRYCRKRLIILADLLIALSTLSIALLFLSGIQSIWLIFVIAAIRALGGAVQIPAVGAFLPQLVPQEELTKVNGLNSSLQSMVMFTSPMLSALLLSVSPLETIFFIDVGTALVGVSILGFLLKVQAHPKAREKQTLSYFSDLREGIHYIHQRPFIKMFFLFTAIFFFLSAPAAFLTPLQVTRTFGPEVWKLSAIEVAFSLGMVAGGLLIASWGGLRNKTHTMALGTLLIGGGTLALGMTPVFWSYLFFMTLVGVAIPVFNTPAITLLQEKVDESFLGRVFSVLGMISSTTMPLGMVLFGPLADRLPIEWMLIATGILLVGIGGLMGRNKTLLEAGKQKTP